MLKPDWCPKHKTSSRPRFLLREEGRGKEGGGGGGGRLFSRTIVFKMHRSLSLPVSLECSGEDNAASGLVLQNCYTRPSLPCVWILGRIFQGIIMTQVFKSQLALNTLAGL